MAKKRSDIAYERSKLAVIEARASGLSYTAIANNLGMRRSTVWSHVQKVCDELREEQYAHADSLRTQMAFRLEKLLAVHMPAAETGDMQAGDMVLKISRDLAKLFALNAPEQTNMRVDDTLRVEFVGEMPDQETVTLRKEDEEEDAAPAPLAQPIDARPVPVEDPQPEQPFDPLFGDD